MAHPPLLPVVVVTPVRNEEWILDRFLAVASQCTDLIVVADQGSSDSSREICSRWPKVRLIENPDKKYDEASRQQLLIAEARACIPGTKVILALDADEIIAADAIQSAGWERMRRAKPGTVLLFEKPDLYLSAEHCIRWPTNPVPVGYVDDGAAHRGRTIHSTRIPQPEGCQRLILDDVKILHYAMTNPTLQRAKFRYYSVIENLGQLNPAIRRRSTYRRDEVERWGQQAEAANEHWFSGWERLGIDVRTTPVSRFSWHDFEVLRKFAEFGEARFRWEDIWYFDWEAARVYGRAQSLPGLPDAPIRFPTKWSQWWRDCCVMMYRFASRVRTRWFRRP